MKSREARVYQSYDNFVKRLLFVGSVCPNTRNRYIIYRCLSIWAILASFFSLYTIGSFCRQTITDIGVMTAAITVFVTTINVILKACSFYVHEEKLREVYDTLDTLVEKALIDDRARPVVFSRIRVFYRLSFAQTIFMGVLTFMYVARPAVVMSAQGVENLTYMEYPLPLLNAYPWDINSYFSWQIHYLFEAHVSFFTFSVSASVDAFFGFCLFRISAVFRLLAFEVESKLSSDSMLAGESREQVIRECVERHVVLFKCRDVVQGVYGPVILMVTITNAVGMCSLIFQTVQVTGIGVGKAATFALYLSMKLLQTFSYAWPGDVIITDSENFRQEIYNNGWYTYGDPNFSKHFLLVLKQRSMIMRACDITQVSLDLFAKILNTTISYYFLLETIDSGD